MDAVTAERLAVMRAAEDAAMKRWSQACAEFDHAVDRRERAVVRARAVVRRRMEPLTPQHYGRIERKREQGRYLSLARTDGQWVAHLAHTRGPVEQARARLAEVTAAEDAKVELARVERAEATRELLRVVPQPELVTGLSAQQLGVMRRR